MHPGGLSGAIEKSRFHEQQVDIVCELDKASVGPVSPLYTMAAPVASSSTRMPYASTGCATRTVWTVNGPIRWLGCQVRQSKCSAMDGPDSPVSQSLSATS